MTVSNLLLRRGGTVFLEPHDISRELEKVNVEEIENRAKKTIDGEGT